MKKIQYIIVPALALMMFAACNTEVKGPSQAEIDAQVDAKVKSATEQLKAECDSRIMTAAQLQKDSILVKLGKQKPSTTPSKTSTPKQNPPKQTTPKVEPPKTIGNGKPKIGANQNSNEVGDGKPKMGGNKDANGKVDDTKVGNGKPKIGNK